MNLPKALHRLHWPRTHPRNKSFKYENQMDVWNKLKVQALLYIQAVIHMVSNITKFDSLLFLQKFCSSYFETKGKYKFWIVHELLSMLLCFIMMLRTKKLFLFASYSIVMSICCWRMFPLRYCTHPVPPFTSNFVRAHLRLLPTMILVSLFFFNNIMLLFNQMCYTRKKHILMWCAVIIMAYSKTY